VSESRVGGGPGLLNYCLESCREEWARFVKMVMRLEDTCVSWRVLLDSCLIFAC